MVTMEKSVYDYPIRIRFSGQYDYDGLLELCRAFFARHRFDTQETKFKYKTGGSGSEVEFNMDGQREVTHYLKVTMNLWGKIFDMKRKPVVVDGNKRMLTNGRLDLKISGTFVLDYADKFGKTSKSMKKLEKWMQDQLDNDPEGLQFYEMKQNGKKYMQKTLMAFADEIKSFLAMETMRDA